MAEVSSATLWLNKDKYWNGAPGVQKFSMIDKSAINVRNRNGRSVTVVAREHGKFIAFL